MVTKGWKAALIHAAQKMNRHRIKGNKARVVLNGENVVMGRAKRGIYAGRHIQFGNRVSEDGGNKTRRTWKPNVQKKRLYSFALDQFLCVHVTTHAIRCIDKAGGLDEYLINLPDKKMENDLCLYWKRQIQTVNRYLFKLRTGNIPEELHKQLLTEYASRLAKKKGESPPALVAEVQENAEEALVSEESDKTDEQQKRVKKAVVTFKRGKRREFPAATATVLSSTTKTEVEQKNKKGMVLAGGRRGGGGGVKLKAKKRK